MIWMPKLRSTALALALGLLAGGASAGPLDRAKNAVDPDCTPGKAAKGAAMRATVGVGNRCDVGETARDVTGIDDRVDGRNKKGDGPLAKRRND
jgi:hypothetical protein